MVIIPLDPQNYEKHFRFSRDYSLPKIHYISNAIIFNNFVYHPELFSIYKGNYDFFFNRSSIYKEHRSVVENISLNNNIIKLKGSYFYALHPYSHNYSHYTLNCLASLMFFDRYFGISDKLKILLDDSKKFQCSAIKFNKINSKAVDTHLTQNQLYICDNLILTSISFITSYHESVIRLFTQHLPSTYSSSPQLRLYISRRNNHIRHINNEVELEKYLSKYDYLCVDFAKLSVEEQVLLLNKSTEIFAPHGASGANWVYLDDKPRKIIEFFKDDWTFPCHTKILVEKNCFYVGFTNEKKLNANDGSFEVNFNKVDYALSSAGIRFKAEMESESDPDVDILGMLKKHRIILDTESSNLFNMFERETKYAEGIKYLLENYTSKFADKVILYCFMTAQYETLEHFLYDYSVEKLDKQLFYDTLLKLRIYQQLYKDIPLLLSKYADIKYFKMLEWKSFISLILLNSHSLATWHNSILYANIKTMKLSQIYAGITNIKLGIINGEYRLVFYPQNIPILSLDKNGRFSFKDNLINYNVICNGENSFSIYIEDVYLSARPDCTISSAICNREFEHFYNLNYSSLEIKSSLNNFYN